MRKIILFWLRQISLLKKARENQADDASYPVSVDIYPLTAEYDYLTYEGYYEYSTSWMLLWRAEMWLLQLWELISECHFGHCILGPANEKLKFLSCSKNINVFENTLNATANECVINELVRHLPTAMHTRHLSVTEDVFWLLCTPDLWVLL